MLTCSATTQGRTSLHGYRRNRCFPWTAMAPTEWMRAWQTMWRIAPDNLAQSILQGWTLNINSNNSTAPQTEVEVVAKHSYGRQLGRMSEALELLIVERHGATPEDK